MIHMYFVGFFYIKHKTNIKIKKPETGFKKERPQGVWKKTAATFPIQTPYGE